MKRFLFLSLFAAFLILPSLLPAVSFAAVSDNKPVELINPLGENTDPRVIIGNVIKAVLSIIGSITLLMFVYGGILWITSMGEPKKIQQGKDILTWCVLGLAVIAGAYVLVNAIISGLTRGNITGT